MSAPTSLITQTTMHDSLSLKSNDFELIDNKFNELAKKILEEFKQAQYSRDFFQALDDILKEPAKKSFSLKSRRPAPVQKSASHLKYFSNSSQQRTDNQQPRSLPADVANPVLHQQQKQRQIQQFNQQQQQTQRSPLKSAIPTISNGLLSKSPKNLSSGDERGASNGGYHISRSATIGAADTAMNVRRQQQLRKLSTQSAKNQQVANNQEKQVAAAVHATSLGIAQRRLINSHSPSSVSQAIGRIRQLVAHDNYYDDEDDEEEEDDDDDDDDDDEEEDDDDCYGEQVCSSVQDRDTPNDRPISYESKRYKAQQQPQQQHQTTNNMVLRSRKLSNPIVKSKTLSDATNISEMSMLTKRQGTKTTATNNSNSRQALQQQSLHASNNHQRQRFNPIVRSNTVNSTNASQKVAANQDRNENYLQQPDLEPKSITLSGKDFGPLWKPHMNYSTSVLGNHRLSDDDEIIIIPTQSPSFVSPSPDGGDVSNADELSERFSISRTKSFWEKLSKGSPGKRSSKDTSEGAVKSGSRSQMHGKVMGTKSNGLSRTLDRMDSTGGSNSNYSCSSSGDENSGCHSQQNPTVSQLQEMSRQNRLRQTR